MRDKRTTTKEFRELVSEVAMLMAYEVTRDLPLEEVEIETPVAIARTKVLAGKKLALVPILRAGLGMVDGMLNLLPMAKVGHIGLYRDPKDTGTDRVLLQAAGRCPGARQSSFWTRCWPQADQLRLQSLS